MKKLIITLTALVVVANAFGQKTKVKMETTFGTITLMLYDKTPQNSNNMIKVAGEHRYDSTLFHRIIPEFMIQGGDPDSKHAKPGQALGSGGLNYKVPAEFNEEYFHKKGALAVARENTPDKAGSPTQFYIVVGKKYTEEQLTKMEGQSGRKFTAAQREAYKTVGGTPFLDNNYTVFGEVLTGMDVVEKIVLEPRDARDRPNNDVRILSVRVMKPKKKFRAFLERIHLAKKS